MGRDWSDQGIGCETLRPSLDAELECRAAVWRGALPHWQPGRGTCQDVGVLVDQRSKVRGVTGVRRKGVNAGPAAAKVTWPTKS
jgi:hypothetical protein